MDSMKDYPQVASINSAASKLIRSTIEKEGGYNNRSSDTGGATKYGISSASYPDVDIKNLTKQDAFNIYYKDYFLKGQFNLLPAALQVLSFDTAVNSGITAATKMLQKSLGVTADGLMGPNTLAAAHTSDIKDSVDKFFSTRNDFYQSVNNKYNRKASKVGGIQNEYIAGWLNRSKATYTEALATLKTGAVKDPGMQPIKIERGIAARSGFTPDGDKKEPGSSMPSTVPQSLNVAGSTITMDGINSHPTLSVHSETEAISTGASITRVSSSAVPSASITRVASKPINPEEL